MNQEKIYKFGILGIVVILIATYTFLSMEPKVPTNTSDIKSTIPTSITESARPNVVFIILDTVRPDHLSAYGYQRNTSPNIDELAKKGTLFSNAFTVIPYTTAAHISMMTSLYPFVYQPRMPNAQPTGVVTLKDEYITLAEVLKSNGYNTAAFISVSMMAPSSGLDSGFDVYNYSVGVRRGNETVKIANEWLEENYEDPFFLWYHSYDPHDSYEPPEPFNKEFDDIGLGYDNISLSDFTAMKQALAKYDEDIHFGDHNVGLLLDKINELGLENNTLIIFMSDHGEQFGEHLIPVYQGMGPQVVFEHARALYDQEIRVPFIMKGPGIPEGEKRTALVQNIDITPTILETLNIPLSNDFQGKSLVPVIQNDEEVNDFVISHLYPIISTYYRTMIRTQDYKLIYDHYQRDSQFFDLRTDPQEQINLFNESSLVIDYEELLIKTITDNSHSTDIYVLRLEPEDKKNLEAAGYYN